MLNVFSFSKRQFNREPAALAGLAFDDHASVVGIHDVFDDTQPDSNPLRFAAQFRTQPVKPLEYFLVFRRRNTRTVVGNVK